MKQLKTQEVRLTRADLIAYIAERERQAKSCTNRKTQASKSKNNQESAYCMIGLSD